MQQSTIQKALVELETAWKKIKNTPVSMSVEEFERRLLKQAKRNGVQYSTEAGKWLDMAKRAISDPGSPQGERNLYFAEANPVELEPAKKKFLEAFMKLHALVEWGYKDISAFVNNPSKDERLRTWVRWRVLPVAEAYHKLYELNLRGEMTEQKYFGLRPTIVLQEK